MNPTPIAAARAKMPAGSNQILDQRTLEAAYRPLAALITPGMAVLDVGCGTGAITVGMAARAGGTGTVIGIDPSER
jgi:ubiquinone/menaquinone biosynthesis C-methylase UbiE